MFYTSLYCVESCSTSLGVANGHGRGFVLYLNERSVSLSAGAVVAALARSGERAK